MSTHTPGPWRYESDQHGRRIRGGSMFLTSVAFPAEYNPGGLTPSGEVTAANCRLIAAAPELLDASKEAIRVLIKKGCGHLNTNHFRTTCECCAAIRQLQAAVYAAQGESSGIPKISPSAGPRTELVAESSDGPANSSKGKVEQKPTPGAKSIGSSTARTFRLLKDAGEDFEKRIQDPDP